MRDYVKNTIKLPENELARSFAKEVPGAFVAYKKTANMNRAYMNWHFKEKRKTRAQCTMDKIKKEAHDNLAQGKAHKKLKNLSLRKKQWDPSSPDN